MVDTNEARPPSFLGVIKNTRRLARSLSLVHSSVFGTSQLASGVSAHLALGLLRVSRARRACVPPSMAAPITAAAAARSAVSPAHRVQAMAAMLNRSSASFPRQSASFPSIRLKPVPKRFQVSCAAKQDTIEKVSEIVKNQLAVAEGTIITGETKFVDLGADSLDTVEIVMGLEETFQITVDESSAQVIQTVEDAAALIDKLVAEKDG